MKEEIRWTRLAAEGAVIVASILLAFAVDAAWTIRQERGREASALAGIAQDFEGHRAILEARIAMFERRLEAADELLGLVGPTAAADDPTIAATLGTVGLAGVVRFQGGTLETLVATDGLSLLRNEGLRVALARWRQGLDDLEVINEFLMTEANKLLDYLRPRISIQEIDRQAGFVEVPPSAFDSDFRGILRDLEFSNMLYQQRFATSGMLDYLRGLLEVVDRVLVQVDG